MTTENKNNGHNDGGEEWDEDADRYYELGIYTAHMARKHSGLESDDGSSGAPAQEEAHHNGNGRKKRKARPLSNRQLMFADIGRSAVEHKQAPHGHQPDTMGGDGPLTGNGAGNPAVIPGHIEVNGSTNGHATERVSTRQMLEFMEALNGGNPTESDTIDNSGRDS